jgi:hypothetical protein
MGYQFSVVRVTYLTHTLQMLDESSKASLIADLYMLIADLYMLEESIKASRVADSLEKLFYLVDLPYGDGDEVLAPLPIRLTLADSADSPLQTPSP